MSEHVATNELQTDRHGQGKSKEQIATNELQADDSVAASGVGHGTDAGADAVIVARREAGPDPSNDTGTDSEVDVEETNDSTKAVTVPTAGAVSEAFAESIVAAFEHLMNTSADRIGSHIEASLQAVLSPAAAP